MSEFTVEWDGEDLEFANSDLVQELLEAPIFEDLAGEHASIEYPGFGVQIDTSVFDPRPRGVQLVLRTRALDTDPEVGRRRLVSHYNTLCQQLNPRRGEKRLMFVRTDEDGSMVSRYLRAVFGAMPAMKWTPSGGRGTDGIRMSATMNLSLAATSRFGWFVDEAPMVYAEDDSFTFYPLGHGRVGWRLTALSGGSAPTISVQVANDAGTVSMDVAVDGGTWEAGDVLEWWCPGASLGYPLGSHSFRGSTRGILRPVGDTTLGYPVWPWIDPDQGEHEITLSSNAWRFEAWPVWGSV